VSCGGGKSTRRERLPGDTPPFALPKSLSGGGKARRRAEKDEKRNILWRRVRGGISLNNTKREFKIVTPEKEVIVSGAGKKKERIKQRRLIRKRARQKKGEIRQREAGGKEGKELFPIFLRGLQKRPLVSRGKKRGLPLAEESFGVSKLLLRTKGGEGLR